MIQILKWLLILSGLVLSVYAIACLSNVMEKYRTKVLFSPDVKGYTKENFSPESNGLMIEDCKNPLLL